MPVLIELRHSPKLANAAFAARPSGPGACYLKSGAVPSLPGFVLDESFAPVALPGRRPVRHSGDRFGLDSALNLHLAAENSTYLVRGKISSAGADAFAEEARKSSEVVGVFADVPIAPTGVCPGSLPAGAEANGERLLGTPSMLRRGRNGTGVLVAVVDTGINLQELQARGMNPITDPARSWVWGGGVTPFDSPVGHGTQCAGDVLVAAPRATLLDIALLRPAPSFPTLLSDAVRAFRHLLTLLLSTPTPLPLVVINGWDKCPGHRDFPVGNPGNCSHNPVHPFNVIVASLERAGADNLFAAGNCGVTGPERRCVNPDTGAPAAAGTIVGASSRPAPLAVGGMEVAHASAEVRSHEPGLLQPVPLGFRQRYPRLFELLRDPRIRSSSCRCPTSSDRAARVRVS